MRVCECSLKLPGIIIIIIVPLIFAVPAAAEEPVRDIFAAKTTVSPEICIH